MALACRLQARGPGFTWARPKGTLGGGDQGTCALKGPVAALAESEQE